MVFSPGLALRSQRKARKIHVYVGGLLGFAVAAVWMVGWKPGRVQFGQKTVTAER